MEYEVKFKIEDKKLILNRLRELGAKDLGEKEEINIVLNSGGKAVRVKKTGKEGIITLKEIVRKNIRAKVRKETETVVSDADIMIEIFKQLGFSELKRTEKKRHTFKLDNTLILIDRLPFMGYFIELEASSERDLKRTSKKLDLDYNMAIGESYDNLFLTYYIRNAKKFEDSKVKILPLFKSEIKFNREKPVKI